MIPPPPDPSSVRRLLVRATNWIGDIVMIAPSLAALRRRFAAARIEIVATPHMAECLRGNPSIDEVIVYDRRGPDRGAAGLLRVARVLRGRGYDAAVLFPKAINAALMARLARVPVRIGLAADGRAWLLTHPVPLTEALARRHHVEIFAEVARAAGADVSDLRLHFPVGDDDRAWADAFLRERGAGRFPFLVGIHAGASKRPRAWHLDRFTEVARRLAEGRGAGIVLLGGRAEAEETARVAAALGDRALDAGGRGGVRQTAALIARCRLLIGNDSGPMHLAGALGVPVVAIFGPGDPDRTAPYAPRDAAPRVAVVSRRYPCAPCRQAFFRECFPSPAGKPMCLESIPVEEVVAAAERLLAG